MRKQIIITGGLLFLIFIARAFPFNLNTTGYNPFRIAVVIGDQWDDPSSYLIKANENPGRSDVTSIFKANDFHHLVVLLKSWSIPFDIIRLDQQFLDRYMFLDMYGKPKYGAIIWDVNDSDNLLPADFSIITEVVNKHGIGLIALSDRITQPEIQSLLGIKYSGSWQSNTKMEVKGSHFLTAGLNSPFEMDEEIWVHTQRQQIELKGATDIIVQAGYVQATANELPSGARTVWIGNDHNYLFFYKDVRTLLRRAITWTIGYCVYKTYPNEIIMIMDDPGGSQNVYLDHWHHPVLTEQEITNYLIQPLKKNHAVLNVNFVPGFVNEEKGRLEPTWNENFVDDLGTKQDYISSKRGYVKGINEGVFEVMCHGLTHMQPDLVSEPRWYGAPLDKEKSEVGWYREFGDVRRHKEIPASEQRWRMNTAKEWIFEQFGVVPLEFCAGGGGVSNSYHNNTSRLAGESGFGWLGWGEGYLGKDMAIVNWMFPGKESPLIVPSLPNGHDFGITYAPEEFAKIFDQYPDGKFISINEFIGYLHAITSGEWRDEKQLEITIDYDPHYCRYFGKHPTLWNIEFADWLTAQNGIPKLTIDGETAEIENLGINIPKGIGKHVVGVQFQ